MKIRKEKRRAERSVYESHISFELISPGPEGLRQVKYEARSFDISQEGIGLFTDYPLKKDDVIKLYFPLSPYRTALPVFARVAWAQPAEGKFRVGMQFLH